MQMIETYGHTTPEPMISAATKMAQVVRLRKPSSRSKQKMAGIGTMSEQSPFGRMHVSPAYALTLC